MRKGGLDWLALVAVVFVSATVGSRAVAVETVIVERLSGQQLKLRWQGAATANVYMADRPDAPLDKAVLVSANDSDGEHLLAADTASHPYLLVRDNRTGEVRRVAERVLPLEAGSNFRDLGGYPAVGGKHVRWGLIYRSAGQPLLNAHDLGLIGKLGLGNLVDLRSVEERRLAPTSIEGVPYNAIGYSFGNIRATQIPSMGSVYGNFPTLMAPHLKLIFNRMLGDGTPLAFNCSAGQDRTGFVAAMILTALGVPQDVILEDFHLTTKVRQPQFEMPRIDPAQAANDPVAMMFASYQRPERATPTPLMDAQGKSFLSFAVEAAAARHGSIDAYLEIEAGLTPARRQALRDRYLE
jgi:protein-tyrosine phosphatase